MSESRTNLHIIRPPKGTPPEVVHNLGRGIIHGQKMDSLAIATLQQNTQAVTMLTGSLWVLAGFSAVLACGLAAIYYTLKGR